MRTGTSTTARTRCAAVLSLAVLAAGCGQTTVDPSSAPPDSADPTATPAPRTELTIERDLVPATEPPRLDGFTPGTWTLTCQPTGGDHPDPPAACAVLDEVDPDVFEPVGDDQACTMIYGGPERATVTGHIGDMAVDAEFSRTDGCEIDRWNRVSALLNP